jgi:hypothetical protein
MSIRKTWGVFDRLVTARRMLTHGWMARQVFFPGGLSPASAGPAMSKQAHQLLLNDWQVRLAGPLRRPQWENGHCQI